MRRDIFKKYPVNIVKFVRTTFFRTPLVAASYVVYLWLTETYSEPIKTSKIELFAKINNDLKPLTIFAKSFTLDICLGSEDSSR